MGLTLLSALQTIPLEDGRGEVRMKISVSNWTKKIKPHPHSDLNVDLEHFRFELVEQVTQEEVS